MKETSLLIAVLILCGCVKNEAPTKNTGGAYEMSGKKILMVVAPKDFRDEELLKPKEIFEKTGAQVTVASRGVSTARGIMGAEVPVDADISSVSAEDFHAVVFVGGGGAQVYFNDESALSLAREFYNKGKVTSAICIAPAILANAGVLKGKKATVWSSMTSKQQVNQLKAGGAQYTGDKVTVDGKIVTGNGPEAAEEFANKILDALSTQ